MADDIEADLDSLLGVLRTHADGGEHPSRVASARALEAIEHYRRTAGGPAGCPECGGRGARGCGAGWHDGRPDAPSPLAEPTAAPPEDETVERLRGLGDAMYDAAVAWIMAWANNDHPSDGEARYLQDTTTAWHDYQLTLSQSREGEPTAVPPWEVGACGHPVDRNDPHMRHKAPCAAAEWSDGCRADACACERVCAFCCGACPDVESEQRRPVTDTRPGAKTHRAETGHDMALVSAVASSCAECDWSCTAAPTRPTREQVRALDRMVRAAVESARDPHGMTLTVDETTDAVVDQLIEEAPAFVALLAAQDEFSTTPNKEGDGCDNEHLTRGRTRPVDGPVLQGAEGAGLQRGERRDADGAGLRDRPHAVEAPRDLTEPSGALADAGEGTAQPDPGMVQVDDTTRITLRRPDAPAIGEWRLGIEHGNEVERDGTWEVEWGNPDGSWAYPSSEILARIAALLAGWASGEGTAPQPDRERIAGELAEILADYGDDLTDADDRVEAINRMAELSWGTAPQPDDDLREAAQALLTVCRECRDEAPPLSTGITPADFIIWGKLTPPEGLGPKCYDHAVKYLGRDMPARSESWAVVDLRPLRAALAERGTAPQMPAEEVLYDGPTSPPFIGHGDQVSVLHLSFDRPAGTRVRVVAADGAPQEGDDDGQ